MKKTALFSRRAVNSSSEHPPALAGRSASVLNAAFHWSRVQGSVSAAAPLPHRVQMGCEVTERRLASGLPPWRRLMFAQHAIEHSGSDLGGKRTEGLCEGLSGSVRAMFIFIQSSRAPHRFM